MLHILIGFFGLGFLMLVVALVLAILGATGVIKKGPYDSPYSTIMPFLMRGGTGISLAALAGVFVYLAHH